MCDEKNHISHCINALVHKYICSAWLPVWIGIYLFETRPHDVFYTDKGCRKRKDDGRYLECSAAAKNSKVIR